MKGTRWESDFDSSLPDGVQVNGVWSEWQHEVDPEERG
ncbi:hypothetical protein HNR10_002616 [Nocardiopsis aegyptia]|uniref:Uncharacterized protein n=1 Tax=Nocardiopsis aegyptia TaxID=220378 RepID=A0A7Z0EP12_9ACTN|nr:hypothetical protein [Nocardiopsis aegyptia]